VGWGSSGCFGFRRRTTTKRAWKEGDWGEEMRKAYRAIRRRAGFRRASWRVIGDVCVVESLWRGGDLRRVKSVTGDLQYPRLLYEKRLVRPSVGTVEQRTSGSKTKPGVGLLGMMWVGREVEQGNRPGAGSPVRGGSTVECSGAEALERPTLD